MQAPIGIDLDLAYVELYVEDLEATHESFARQYGFEAAGVMGSPGHGYRSVALIRGRAVLVLTEGIADEHPATAYVLAHGDGVADIALRAADVDAVFAAAVAAGARALSEPHDGAQGLRTASVSAFGDVCHTLLQTEPLGAGAALPPGFAPLPAEPAATEGDPAETFRLEMVDHFAVCVPSGCLDQAVDFYADALAFQRIFEERITVGAQTMNSKVVQSASGTLTFTILEPDQDGEPGQIDQFLKDHGGAGVQHVAFATDDIVRAVGSMRRRGVDFLHTPAAYYDLLPNRFVPDTHPVGELRDLGILVDEDHGGELFQIFTRSTHSRLTLFFEVIERVGARLFGSNNIKALYEAVELERSGS